MTDNRTTERVDHPPRVREAIDELMREKDATDNRTTELRISEPLRGFIRHQSNRAYIDGGQARWLTEIADKIDAKHEQAIAATLGDGTLTAEQVREAVMSVDRWEKPMGNTGMTNTHLIIRDDGWQAIADELNAELGGGNCARCAEDMGRYADSLCDPLKERIADLLRCLENDWHIHASWDGLRKFWCIELTEEGVKLRDAAHAERTCRNTRENRWFKCSACGYGFTDLYAEDESDIDEQPRYCPNCGRRCI